MLRHSTFCILFAAALSAQPAEAADTAAGRALAERWCTGCHLVEGMAKGSDAAPTFSAIANRRDRTETEMEAWLTDPHPVMPDLKLSRTQIDDLIAFIESLREE
jgi:mono/diheme cytochrome c family protein